MNKATTEKVCGILEEVLQSLENALIKEGGGGGGSFILVRVRLDITLSLCRGHVIALENGE